jgi:hypothetical protein
MLPVLVVPLAERRGHGTVIVWMAWPATGPATTTAGSLDMWSDAARAAAAAARKRKTHSVHLSGYGKDKPVMSRAAAQRPIYGRDVQLMGYRERIYQARTKQLRSR